MLLYDITAYVTNETNLYQHFFEIFTINIPQIVNCWKMGINDNNKCKISSIMCVCVLPYIHENDNLVKKN